MKGEIKDFAKQLVSSKTSICVVAIMSHGDEQGILCKDGRKVVEDYWIQEQFNNENCENLKGIPKFFIFQACRQVLYSFLEVFKKCMRANITVMILQKDLKEDGWKTFFGGFLTYI